MSALKDGKVQWFVLFFNVQFFYKTFGVLNSCHFYIKLISHEAFNGSMTDYV